MIWPESISNNPAKILTTVLFPLPFFPIIQFRQLPNMEKLQNAIAAEKSVFTIKIYHNFHLLSIYILESAFL